MTMPLGGEQYSAVHSNIFHGQRRDKFRKNVKEIANLFNLLKTLFTCYSIRLEMQKKNASWRGIYWWESRPPFLLRKSMQIHGVQALNCHYLSFPKTASMEILKSAQRLCQFDGRICRFSGSKLIRDGLPCRSEEFSVYSFDSKRIQISPSWKCIIKGEFSVFKNGL